MRKFDFIVVLVVLTQLALLGNVQSFGAVLCVEADGRAEIEEHGCSCASSHTAEETAGQEVDASRVSVGPSDDHCKPCIDIPIGNLSDGLTVRILSKEATKPNTLPSADVAHSITKSINRIPVIGLLPHSIARDPISARFAPLRI